MSICNSLTTQAKLHTVRIATELLIIWKAYFFEIRLGGGGGTWWTKCGFLFTFLTSKLKADVGSIPLYLKFYPNHGQVSEKRSVFGYFFYLFWMFCETSGPLSHVAYSNNLLIKIPWPLNPAAYKKVHSSGSFVKYLDLSTTRNRER